MTYRHLLLLCALVTGCSSAAETAEEQIDDIAAAPVGPVLVGGDRPAEVFVPDGYDHATPTPLLVALHGYTASGGFMSGYLGLEAQANEGGFLYLTPEGMKDANGSGFWNSTGACCDFARTGVDDSGYLRGLIEETSAIYNVDPKRVFVIGHSNGGFMAYTMACHHADLVAGVVSLAGAMLDSCTPSEPVAGLQIHGTADGTVGFGGGAYVGVSYPGAEESIASFAEAVGCSGAVEATGDTYDLEAKIDGAETAASGHAGCVEGAAAELWPIPGGGHIPALSTTFMSSVMDFLLAHPKP